MNYIEKIKIELKQELADCEDELLDVYALLVLTVGSKCTNEHIHDAWSIWENRLVSDHPSLQPFKELKKEVQDLDEPYRQAVVKIANNIGHDGRNDWCKR